MSERSIAKLLLDVNAVALQPDDPFRYTSGILSPIYTDNRVIISHPAERKAISKALEKLARANHPKIEVVAGTSTAGIPWAAWVAAGLNVPMVYVRAKAKRHGQKSQVEGVLTPGAKTLVIEGLISTGGSALGTVQAIRKAGGEPLGVVAIFTYEMKQAVDAFREAGVALATLTTFQALTDAAEQLGQLTSESKARVLEWAEDPAGWGKRMGLER